MGGYKELIRAVRGRIVVFDSGVGGISVLDEIMAVCPGYGFCYMTDPLLAPYGEKSEREIRARVTALAGMIFLAGAKALVLACNTATAAAARTIRKLYPSFLVLGTEPAVKPALASHKNAAALVTELTAASLKFNNLIKHLGGENRVEIIACKDLAAIIERGPIGAEAARYLDKKLSGTKTEALVLGCTHYHFLRPLIEERYPRFTVYDGGAGVAENLRKLLGNRPSDSIEDDTEEHAGEGAQPVVEGVTEYNGEKGYAGEKQQSYKNLVFYTTFTRRKDRSYKRRLRFFLRFYAKYRRLK